MSDYEILEKLGEGGMGIVHLARQRSLDRLVALKFLKTDANLPAEVIHRFQREIRTCIRLGHPGIITLYDAGELDGRLYYAMEYLAEAVPLQQLIANEGPLPPERAGELTRQLLEAVAHCHEHGIIHRDIKPANIMVQPGDRVILMDFGLVKSAQGTVLTRAGQALGTPRYMAPEVLQGGDPTPGSDLWAVGVVFYEMLTRRKAFLGRDLWHLIQVVLNESPVPVSELRADVPAGTDELVLTFLCRDAKSRIGSAREALRRLLAWRRAWDPSAPDVSDRDIALPGGSGTQGPSGSWADPAPFAPPVLGERVPLDARAPTGPASIGSGPDLRLRRGFLLLLAGASITLGGGLFSMRSPDPGRPAPGHESPPEPFLDVRLQAGASTLTVEIAPFTASTFRIELGPSESDGDLRKVPVSADPGGRPVTVTLGELVPETEYRLRILDEAGKVCHRSTARTAAIADTLDRLARALEDVDPYRRLQELDRDASGAWSGPSPDREAGPDSGRVRPERPETPEALVSLRRDWERRIRSVSMRTKLTGTLVDLRGIEARILADPALLDRLFGLQEALTELARLDLRLRRLGIGGIQESKHFHEIVMAPLRSCPEGGSHRLTFRFHDHPGGDAASPPPATAAPPDERTTDSPPSGTADATGIQAGFADPFQAVGDPRHPGSRGLLESGEWGTGFHVIPEPRVLVPAGTSGQVVVEAQLHDQDPESAFRLLVGPASSPTDPRWRVLGIIPAGDRGRHRQCFRVPAGLLAGKPLCVQLQIVPDWSWFMEPGEWDPRTGYIDALTFRLVP